MLAHRKISGEYVWTDGTKVTYTGSYEKEFLQFLDVFMNFESSDIMAPSPHTYYYTYNGEKLFYIPDFFIPSLNLEVEIKDGGDNANKHPKIQAVDKVKEKLKDEVMKTQKDYDYIKIVNKNYDNFFEYLLSQKESVESKKSGAAGTILTESINNFDLLLEMDIDYDLRFTKSIKQTKEIIDTLDEEDIKSINIPKTQNPNYSIYREVAVFGGVPVAFIEVFQFPNMKKDEAAIILVCRTEKKYKGYHNSALLIMRMLNALRNESIRTVKWVFNNTNEKTALNKKNFKLKPNGEIVLEDSNTICEDPHLFPGEDKLNAVKTSIKNDTVIVLNIDEFPQNTFITSDLHLYRNNDGSNVAEMVKNINANVKHDDTLIILGDIGYKKDPDMKEHIERFLNDINCSHIWLVIGNHDILDIDDYIELGFEKVCHRINYRGHSLTHYPIHNSDGISVHGHLHNEYLPFEDEPTDDERFRNVYYYTRPIKSINEYINENMILDEGLFNFKGRQLYYISKNKNKKFNKSTVFTADKKKALSWFMEQNSNIKYKEIKKSEYSSWFKDTTELVIDKSLEGRINDKVYLYTVSKSAFDSIEEYGNYIKDIEKLNILNTEEIKLIDLIQQVGIKVTFNTSNPAEISNRKKIVSTLRSRFQSLISKSDYVKFKTTKSLILDLDSEDVEDFVNGNSDRLSFIHYDLNKFYNNKARQYMNEDSAKEYSDLYKAFTNELLSDKTLSKITIKSDGDWDDGKYSAVIKSDNKSIMESSESSILEANFGGFLTKKEINPSKIKTPKDLLNVLNTWGYGLLTKNKEVITNDIEPEQFADLYRTISPQDFEKYKVGVCWDYTEYERYYFKKYFDYKFKTYYIELDNLSSSTHTFLVYEDSGKYYYFESSYRRYQGIHVFETMQDVFNYVLTAMFRDEGRTYPYAIYEYTEMPSGLTTLGFMDMLIVNGKKIYHTYKLYRLTESVDIPVLKSEYPKCTMRCSLMSKYADRGIDCRKNCRHYANMLTHIEE